MTLTAAGFQVFLEEISLTQTQVDRIESARGSLESYLRSEYELSPEDVFVQGSYANGTAVRPIPGGEYDVDIVCVCATQAESAAAALDNLYEVLNNHGTYAGHLVAKQPCVRIEYADEDIGGFHVDVVPVRASTDESAPLDAPRRSSGWHPTAPSEYTNWCALQGELFFRTVKMLKRWRDEQQEVRDAIKSIVLQVLIAQHMPTTHDDAHRVQATFASIHVALESLTEPPAVWNPVLPSENLAAKWTGQSFKAFTREISEAAEIAQNAVNASNAVEAAEAWRILFGEAFPLPSKSLFGVHLADTSHAREPREQGWYEALDSRYKVSLRATEQRGRKGKASPYVSDGPLLFSDKKLRFNATYEAPGPVEIWWRITNTGAHARDVDGLRGNFNRAKNKNGGASPDPTENWEDTKYTGTHLVEVFLVSGARVVARSDPFNVNIFNKQRRWAW